MLLWFEVFSHFKCLDVGDLFVDVPDLLGNGSDKWIGVLFVLLGDGGLFNLSGGFLALLHLNMK